MRQASIPIASDSFRKVVIFIAVRLFSTLFTKVRGILPLIATSLWERLRDIRAALMASQIGIIWPSVFVHAGTLDGVHRRAHPIALTCCGSLGELGRRPQPHARNSNSGLWFPASWRVCRRVSR